MVIPNTDVCPALTVGGLVDGLSIISQRRKSLLNLEGGDGAGNMGPVQHACGVLISNHCEDMTRQDPVLALEQLRVICLHPWGGNIIRRRLPGSDVIVNRPQIFGPS